MNGGGKHRDACITATVCCVTVLSVSLNLIALYKECELTSLSTDLLERCHERCDHYHWQGSELQAVRFAVATERLFVSQLYSQMANASNTNISS